MINHKQYIGKWITNGAHCVYILDFKYIDPPVKNVYKSDKVLGTKCIEYDTRFGEVEFHTDTYTEVVFEPWWLGDKWYIVEDEKSLEKKIVKVIFNE